MFNRSSISKMRDAAVRTLAVLLAATLCIVAVAGSASADRPPGHPGKNKTEVAISTDPGRLDILPSCMGQIYIGITNTSSEPEYATVYITADSPLEASRNRITSYLPVDYTLTIPVVVRVSEGASAGDYELLLTSGHERVRVPVTVASADKHCLPSDQMSATATSAHRGVGPENAIDGDLGSNWHSEYSPYTPLPQAITLDLGGTYDAVELHYWPRNDGNTNGIITKYNVYASSDGESFTKVTSGSWAFDTTRKTATFSAPGARYIRLEATEGGKDGVPKAEGYASASEIRIVVKNTNG